MVLKKVSDSVSEKNHHKNLGFVGLNHGFLKFGIGIGIGFETFPVFWLVSDSVSKKFGIEKSIGFGIGKYLVSKKVSDSVSEIFGINKSIGFSIGKYFGIEKSFRFGI